MRLEDSPREGLEQRKEHILHTLYYLAVEHGESSVSVDHVEIRRHNGEALHALEDEGVVQIDDGRVRLTTTGEQLGADAVRRHRLAERLMSDVLGIPADAGEYIAGEMEHIVCSELTDSICTLLGHPSECPHGNPIPPGRCCQEGAQAVETAVIPLSQMKAGEKGTIAYLSSGPVAQTMPGRHGRRHGPGAGRSRGPSVPTPQGRGRRRVAQLTSLGLFPGEEVEVLQTSPVFVVRVGGTMLALDRDLASCIRVRRSTGERA